MESACFIALIDTQQDRVLEFVNCFDCDWPIDARNNRRLDTVSEGQTAAKRPKGCASIRQTTLPVITACSPVLFCLILFLLKEKFFTWNDFSSRWAQLAAISFPGGGRQGGSAHKTILVFVKLSLTRLCPDQARRPQNVLPECVPDLGL